MSNIKICPLVPQTSNFQLGYIPTSLLGNETSRRIDTFASVSLQDRSRRALVRCSLLELPEDVPDVVHCDLRVQQLLRDQTEQDSGTGNKPRKQYEEKDFLSVSERDQKSEEELEVVLNKETERNTQVQEGSVPPTKNSNSTSHKDEDEMSHESWRTQVLSKRKLVRRNRNDYSEIDLARHVVQVENERKRELAVAEENFLFDEIPSTVRFNDALVCTSKDIQILKPGTIKMMRLTVICHSDLHYQNHKKHHQTHNDHHENCGAVESCCSNETAPKDTVPCTKISSHSSTSSVKVTGDEDKCENISTTFTKLKFDTETENILKCKSPSSSSHQHSNQDEYPLTSNVQKKKKSKTPKSTSSTFPNWKRLQEKIQIIFQTYDVHVSKDTLVHFPDCPLASFTTNFSPAVRFVFVEECQMKVAGTNVGKVCGKTEIIISNVHHISYYHRLLEKKSQEKLHLYGLETAAKILSGLIEIQEKAQHQIQVDDSSVGLTEFSHGLLISGPSGCGKVLVVRDTAKKLGAHLLSFNPVGVSNGLVTDVSHFCQQLTNIFMSALVTASRYPTVLLFPRLHLLFQNSSGGNPSTKSGGFSVSRSGKERVLHHLCKLFDSIPKGLALSVVGTTDKAYLVPAQLRRAGRLEKEIIISPPKELERYEILTELSRDLRQFNTVDLSLVASQTPGYVGQDLLKLLRLALFKCEEEDCSEVKEHHVKYALGRVLPSVLEGALGVVDIQRAISLDHIAGLHSVKLDLIKAIVWPLQHPHAFLRMGISPQKGILLYGPPGNCKTTLVRAVAASHQTNFLSVSAAELFSSGVGDSEKIVAHLFHRARMASPCILFIDELESIVGSRQNSERKQTSTNESILSMLLTEMDGVGIEKIEDSKNTEKSTSTLGPLVLVVAATNRPDLIDPALLRPGRFDKLIPVPALDLKGREELLRFCSKSIPFHQDVDFSTVANETEFYSGADLVNLCREAALFALSENMDAPFVTGKHVNMARAVVCPSLNSEMLRIFHEYGSKTEIC